MSQAVFDESLRQPDETNIFFSDPNGPSPSCPALLVFKKRERDGRGRGRVLVFAHKSVFGCQTVDGAQEEGAEDSWG